MLYRTDRYSKGTRGTETSKYPKEKKTKVIPRVVASEIGGAQTEGGDILGVRSREKAKIGLSRSIWKDTAKEVKRL